MKEVIQTSATERFRINARCKKAFVQLKLLRREWNTRKQDRFIFHHCLNLPPFNCTVLGGLTKQKRSTHEIARNKLLLSDSHGIVENQTTSLSCILWLPFLLFVFIYPYVFHYVRYYTCWQWGVQTLPKVIDVAKIHRGVLFSRAFGLGKR